MPKQFCFDPAAVIDEGFQSNAMPRGADHKVTKLNVDQTTTFLGTNVSPIFLFSRWDMDEPFPGGYLKPFPTILGCIDLLHVLPLLLSR